MTLLSSELNDSKQFGDSFNPFMPTVQTFAVRETSVSRTANVGTVGKNGLISSHVTCIPRERLASLSTRRCLLKDLARPKPKSDCIYLAQICLEPTTRPTGSSYSNSAHGLGMVLAKIENHCHG